MPDPYASITTADPAVLERLVAALEVRATDLLNRGILQEFLSEIPFPEGARVLEIGCGAGAVTRVLAARPDVSETVGVDPSPVFIAKAMEVAPRAGKVRFHEADGRALPLADANFDVVIFHTTLCHVPKPEAALTEALRVPSWRIAGGVRWGLCDYYIRYREFRSSTMLCRCRDRRAGS